MKKAARNQIVFGASPRVDLLPEKQRAEKKHQETLPKLLLVLVSTAVIAGLVWFAGTIPVNLATARLKSVENESAELLAEIASYSDTQQVVSDVNNLSRLRTQVTTNEVLVMDLQDEISALLPSGASIAGFQAWNAANMESSDENLLCPPGAANLVVSLSSDSLVPAAQLVETVSGITGYTCSYVTQIQNEGDRRITTLQIVVNEEAFSGRFQESDEADEGGDDVE